MNMTDLISVLLEGVLSAIMFQMSNELKVVAVIKIAREDIQIGKTIQYSKIL